VGRRMGSVKNKKKNVLYGEAQDIETIIRLRPWIEDECRKKYGDFRKSDLVTDYDAKTNIFKFKLFFHK
jgi:hypothetical protein